MGKQKKTMDEQQNMGRGCVSQSLEPSENPWPNRCAECEKNTFFWLWIIDECLFDVVKPVCSTYSCENDYADYCTHYNGSFNFSRFNMLSRALLVSPNLSAHDPIRSNWTTLIALQMISKLPMLRSTTAAGINLLKIACSIMFHYLLSKVSSSEPNRIETSNMS